MANLWQVSGATTPEGSCGARRILGLTVALATVVLGGAGCQSVTKSRSEWLQTVGLYKPAPPTQFVCIIEPSLQSFPDTLHNGQPTRALLGRMYLFGRDSKPVDAYGELTLTVNDATPRPQGAPAKKEELVHLDSKALKSLVSYDERFGRHYVFIFPWPDTWNDVSQIAVQARFTPHPDLKAPDLFHQLMKVSISGDEPTTWTDKNTGQTMRAPGGENPQSVTRGVPSPKDFLNGADFGSGMSGLGNSPQFPNQNTQTKPVQPVGLNGQSNAFPPPNTLPPGFPQLNPTPQNFPKSNPFPQMNQQPQGFPQMNPLPPTSASGSTLPTTSTSMAPDGRKFTTTTWVAPPPQTPANPGMTGMPSMGNIPGMAGGAMPGQGSFPGMQPSQMTLGQPIVPNLGGMQPPIPVNPQSSTLQTQIWPPAGGIGGANNLGNAGPASPANLNIESASDAPLRPTVIPRQ